MSRLRLVASTVLCAAGLLLGMVWLPAAALASNISFLSAGPDSNNDPYNLTIVADDGNNAQILTMTAHVYNASMQDVADPTMAYVSGTPAAQTWVASPAISESALLPGTYTVMVDVNDGVEPADTGLAAGSFSFSYATTVSVTPSQQTVSQGSQSVTFTGTVQGAAPGGTPVGLGSGIDVDLSIGGGAATLAAVTTDANGDFSDTVSNISTATDYNFSVAAVPGTYSAGNDDVPVGIGQATTGMSVTPTPLYVTQGAQNVTFSGTVSVTPIGSVNQVGIGSGVPILLSIGGAAATQVTSTTDAAGDFSYSVNGITQSDDYNFSVASTSLYTASSYDVTVNAQAATTAVNVIASAQTVALGSQSVTFTGTATITPPGSSTSVSIGAGVPVYLSISGGSANQIGTTGSNGGFTDTVSGIAATSDYDFSILSTSLYSAVSQDLTITATQAPSKMTVTPSPAFVTWPGAQSVTFSGTVTAQPGTTPIGIGTGVPVDLSIGGAAATQVTTTTDANGDFSYTVPNISAATDYNFSVAAAGLYTQATDDIPVPVDPAQTTMTVTANPPDSDLSSSTVTFSGTVNVTPFGSTTQQNIGSGVPILLSISGAPAAQITTTDTTGSFSDTITGITQPGNYQFSVASATLYAAASADVPIGPQEQTTLTVTPSQSSITEGSQNVTFNGTVTGLTSGGSTPQPISGVPIDLSVNGQSSGQVATSNSQGAFSDTISGISQAATYGFTVALTSNYTGATANVPIAISPAQTRIVTNVSPAHLKYGQDSKLSGTVEYLKGTSWTAMPGAKVSLAEGTTSLGTATANGTGSFSATLPTTHGPSWSATLGAGNLSQQAMAIGNLTIDVPMKVGWFTASLGANNEVNVKGCLLVTVPVGYGPRTTVNIQYGSSPRGKWASLGKVQLYNVAHTYKSCGAVEDSYFTGAIHAKVANAYYRADFAANASFEGAASKVIHAWRTPTRIISFNVSTHSLVVGRVAVISGRLQVLSKSWKGFGHQLITITYNYKGTNSWETLQTNVPVKTNASGYFSVWTSVHKKTAQFVIVLYANYRADKTHLTTQSGGIDITVNPSSVTGFSAMLLDQPPFLAPGSAVLGPVVALSIAAIVRS